MIISENIRSMMQAKHGLTVGQEIDFDQYLIGAISTLIGPEVWNEALATAYALVVNRQPGVNRA